MQATNQFMCSPLGDPMLISVDPIYEGNDDYDILCCYVMYRFAPDLLTFPFDKNRSFKPETVGNVLLSRSLPLYEYDVMSFIGSVEISSSFSNDSGMESLISIALFTVSGLNARGAIIMVPLYKLCRQQINLCVLL